MSTILKNADGKILRNGDGKLLKQNFNFGNGIIRPAGVNAFCRVYISSGSLSHFTVVLIGDTSWPNATHGYSQYQFQSGTLSGLWKAGNPIGRIQTSFGGSYNTVGAYYSSIIQFGYEVDIPNQQVHLVKNGEIYNETLSIPYDTEDLLSFVDIMRGLRNSSFGGSEYPPDGKKMDELLIYSRSLSNNELKFLYNNQLYNEPLSEVGLVARIRFSRAELLDFSAAQDGSDMRVGCEDSSGNNNHGELLGLPAGTLEEKRDYANANLLTSFI